MTTREAEPEQEQQGIPEEYLEDPRRLFEELVPEMLETHPEARPHFAKGRAVAQIELTGARGGQWYFVMHKGDVRCTPGTHHKPSFRLIMTVETFQGLMRGKLNGLSAWMRGRVKIKGSKIAFLRVARLFG